MASTGSRPCPPRGTARDRRTSHARSSRRSARVRRSLARASRIAAVASRPPISGICTSMRTMSNALVRRCGPRLRGRSVATATDVARLFEHRRHELLVGRVVFGNEDAQRLAVRVCADRSEAGGGSADAEPEQRQDRIEQLRLLDRLGQVGREPAASARATPADQSGRRQHDQLGTFGTSAQSSPIVARERETVDVGHQRVGEDEAERIARVERPRRSADSAARAPSTRRRLHPPVGEHLLENPAVRRVVVDDQHSEVFERRRRRRTRAGGCSAPGRSAR